MPELPEVETVAAGLRDGGLVGRTITSVNVGWPRTIAEPSATVFKRGLAGQKVKAIGRRAKYLVLSLESGQTVLIHLRMTGHLFFAPASEQPHGHEYVVLRLDDGRELRFRDTRKFGRWWLTDTPERILDRLGPEPLAPSFRAPDFVRLMSARRGMLKPLLLNQSFLAGLGNIYVDEALWAAGLHPERRAETLNDDDRRRLYRAIRKALRRGIRSMGTTLGNGLTTFRSVWGRRGTNRAKLNVFRRTGQPCPRCGDTIVRLIVGQRSTHICPRCQPRE